jgi:hypothetical protein
MSDKLDEIKRLSKPEIETQSIRTSVGFHEKLAVLTAASLALAVEMAGKLYENPLLDASTMDWLFYGLAASAGCLWLSLIASIAHNYLELVAQREDTLAEKAELLPKIFQIAAESVHKKPDVSKAVDEAERKAYQADLEEEQMEEASPYRRRARSYRKWEVRLSVIAVALFVFGYLWAVAYVIVLRR